MKTSIGPLILVTLLATACLAYAETAKRRAVGAVPSAPVSNGLPWASSVTVTTDATYRYIRSNGIPDHPTGTFPNSRNPNTISPQNYSFRLPLNPTIAPAATVTSNRVGVAINGVLFDPGTAEWWRNNPAFGWHYEALTGGIDLGADRNNAHVQPTGAYHYHSVPEGLLDVLGRGANVTQVGWMADGFPLYARYAYSDPYDASSAVKQVTPSYRIKQGTRPSGPGGAYDGTFEQDWEYVAGLGDLDQCNGRIGVNPDGSVGYHYYVTDAYPFVPRCMKGRPDPSFGNRP